LELQILKKGMGFSTILADDSKEGSILFQAGKSSHVLGYKLLRCINKISIFFVFYIPV
jgi:hypothetical protein